MPCAATALLSAAALLSSLCLMRETRRPQPAACTSRAPRRRESARRRFFGRTDSACADGRQNGVLSQPEPGLVISVRRLHIWWRGVSEQWLTVQPACCGRLPVCNRVPIAGMELAPLKGRAKPSHLESVESALILAQRLQSSSACATDASTGAEGKACDLGACQSPGARRTVSSVFAEAASSSAAAEDTGASRRLALLPLRQEDSASELHRGGRSRHSPRCCERAGNECTGAAAVRACQAGLAAEPVAGSAVAVFACERAAPAPDRHARAGKGPALSGCKSGETDVLLVGGTDSSSSGAGPPAEEGLWYRQRQVVLTLSGYGCALVGIPCCRMLFLERPCMCLCGCPLTLPFHVSLC